MTAKEPPLSAWGRTLKVLEEIMYAVICTGGKQYQVAQGERIRVEKLAGDIGDTVEIVEVLLVNDGEEVKVGQPVVTGAKVLAKIVEQDRAKKIVVFKKKRRKGYRRKTGHRQPFTAIEIQEISV
jgi:large subunit ribosomal protein L21